MINVNSYRPISIFGCGFEGNKIYSLEDVVEFKPYFLVASEKYYSEIKKQLEEKGLTEFDDFIKANAYNKKICLINANCYGPIYNDFLNSSKMFSSEYYVYDSVAFYNVKEAFMLG